MKWILPYAKRKPRLYDTILLSVDGSVRTGFMQNLRQGWFCHERGIVHIDGWMPAPKALKVRRTSTRTKT